MVDMNGVNGAQRGGQVFGKLNISSETLKNLKKVKVNQEIANKLTNFGDPFKELRAPQAELEKLGKGEQKLYNELFHYTNSKSHGMDPEKDAQIKEWNKTHPDCQIRSQYDNNKMNIKF